MLKKAMKYLRWLYAHSKGARGAIVANIVLGSTSVGLNLYFIFLCKRLVDVATGVFDGNIYWYTALAIIVTALRLAVQAVNQRIENLTTSKMSFIIRKDLYSNLLQAEWLGKEKRHSGDVINRMETDVNSVTSVICEDVPRSVTTVIQLIAAVIFLCTMDWRLALVILLISPAFIAFGRIFVKKMRRMTRGIRDTESQVQSHLQESLQHRMLIQSMETVPMMEDKLDDLQNTEYGQVMERTRFNVFARTMIGSSFAFGYIAAFLWGAYGIWRGTITYGVMTAFLQIVGQIQRPIVELTRELPAIVNATASIDRLMELEDTPKEESGEPIKLSVPTGVRIDNVSYRYPDGDHDILRNFSFDFPPLSRTAVVGETGSGKSTMIRLILALLKPSEGSVTLYDGKQAEAASPRTRCNLVYVPQGNTLLSGTIRDNLRMGDPDADEQQMFEALRTAAAEFVSDLPDGLDTLCGEGGAGLSEGQAQRIAIARGLLRPGSILLLDEFSSSLDPETERRLMDSLIERASGKTIIFITHRERIAEFCDRQCRIERLG